MEHYYTQNPQTPHDITRISYNIKNIQLEFFTDSGVFSKKQVDFGTHVMLNTLPALKGKVLDLGCGYGAIGITTARLNPESNVIMLDINERAVELANQNIKLNKVANAQVLQSDGFENITVSYDYIITNPPIRAGKKVIYYLFEKSIDFLVSGGSIYVVIQKKQGAPSAVKKLEEIYGNCQVINKEKGYWILHSNKM